jgi:bifunctional UDP-N-acetylglucosamine pyrophosphorylase/glucosamine-1-phosphate N-acetyltransferase
MTSQPWLSLILAAGLGTRMKSAMPKVLHPIAGRPMLAYSAAAALEAGAAQLGVVVGPDMEAARGPLAALTPHAQFFLQQERLGTAHAVLAARALLAECRDDVLILYGDTPLLRAETLNRLRGLLTDSAGVAVLGFEAADPSGYGRLLLDKQGRLEAIREEKDASDAERALTLCNSGVMAFRAGLILPMLERIGNDNAKGEYYLTDAVGLARSDGLSVGVVICDEEEVAGVNDRVQLARTEALMQARLRAAAMHSGTTMIAPETVTMSYDTRLGQDVVIEPNVFFGPDVTVEDDAEIKANCYMEQAHIGKGAIVGPFARLRPGARIGPGAKIGNFVEVKNATVEAGAKVNHLAYVGDARVGAEANLGAGTIVCNYDGFAKHFTDIGEKAFVGSNSALVAPVKIGDGAYIATGSVITDDVESDALAFGRARQVVKPGRAAQKRTAMRKK